MLQSHFSAEINKQDIVAVNNYRLLPIMVGAVRPLGRRKAPSGIAKEPVTGPVMLTISGFHGDAQGDTKNHGGPDKAVHHYPFDHYPKWRDEIGSSVLLDRPGAFGENISTLGMSEETVAIGDVYAIGDAIIEVSQGRQPCWKLNERFGNEQMSRSVQALGRTGWYCRVLREGMVQPGEQLELIDRHSPEWTLWRIWHCFYVDRLNLPELEAIAELPKLSENWRRHARRRLETQSVEDWTRRLEGVKGSRVIS